MNRCIEFDSLKAGVSYPWLATKYAWSNGGKTLTFTIRTGVKWSDGSAFTPADVAATFNLVNNDPRGEHLGTSAVVKSGDGLGQHGGVELRDAGVLEHRRPSPVRS